MDGADANSYVTDLIRPTAAAVIRFTATLGSSRQTSKTDKMSFVPTLGWKQTCDSRYYHPSGRHLSSWKGLPCLVLAADEDLTVDDSVVGPQGPRQVGWRPI